MRSTALHFDGVSLTATRQPRDPVGDHHLGAEFHGLRVGTTGEVQAGNAGWKSEIVLDS
jgi:hypothetical protein